ncbi:hypothetical protein GCM10023185_29720 [Hymenobacter saemangeumensis]|uniref:Uncharacterized protein n=1 Tax=Hymenobacter saemangeumensis TaxID=1084522 RepID=A0ABP8IM44_9BACT
MLASARVAFAQAGPELLEACINALRTHPQPPRGRPAHTTGNTERQLRFEEDDSSLTMFGPSHLQTLITGRGPTKSSTAGDTPLREILAQWAEDKGIQLNDPNMTYKQFGFLAARKMHEWGSELYAMGQPSGLLDQVLSPEFLNTLKARIAAGEMVAITSTLRGVLNS